MFVISKLGKARYDWSDLAKLVRAVNRGMNGWVKR